MKNAIGYEEVKAALVKGLKRVGASKRTPKKKAEAVQELGALAIDALWKKKDGSKPDSKGDAFHAQEAGRIAATTHNRYVTRLRRDITELGFISYSYHDEINAIKTTYPKFADDIDNIDTSTHSTIDKSIRDIISKASTSLKKSKRESTIKSLEQFMLELKSVKTQNPVFIALIRRDSETADMHKREESRKVKYMKKQRKFSAVTMLSTIYHLLASDSWEDLTIGISAAIGRRCSEVVHFGAFSKANEKETFAVNFKGMRKSKGKQNLTFKIPSLVDAETLVKAIEKLRDTDRIKSLVERLRGLGLHDAEFSRQLNSSLHSQLGLRVNEIFADIKISKNGAGGWVFKDTRALYARMSYAIYRANAKKAGREGMLDTAYFKSVLLHTDLNETLSYMQFQLSDADIFGAHNIKKTRIEGENLKFSPRLPLIAELMQSEAITSSRAYTKYCAWCIDAVTDDENVTFTTRLLRSGCGGRAETIGLFIAILENARLNESRLIIVSEKEKKSTKKRISKTVTLSVTVTYTKTIEIEYNDGDDENEIIRDEIDFYGYSSFDDSEIIESDYSIDEIIDTTI